MLKGAQLNAKRVAALIQQLFGGVEINVGSDLVGYLASETQTYEEKMALARALKSELPSCNFKTVKTIGMFYYRYGNGGIEKVISLLAKRFCDDGYRVVVVTHAALDDDSYELPANAIHETVSAIDPECPKESVSKRSSELADIIVKNEVDLFIDHAWLSGELIYDLITCKLLGTRFALYVHGVFSYPQIKTDHTRDFFSLCPLLARLCDAVIVQTEMNAQFYSKFCGNTHVIPNPISDEYDAWADRAFANSDEKGKCVLWVGRFEDTKRPEEAIRIFALVSSRAPDARLILVGKSEDGDQEAGLKSLCEDLGVADKVEFVGYTKNVSVLYEKADLLLSTSEIEGFCMVLLEASAAGLPAVMYRLPYLPFSSSDGVVSVPVGDVESAAANVLAIFGDESHYMSMKQGALECYKSFRDYDYDAAWKAVFESLNAPLENPPTDQMEEMMWDVLFDHYAYGSKRMWSNQSRLLDENWRAAAEVAADEIRAEFEASPSYRLGRMLSALPRRIMGKH